MFLYSYGKSLNKQKIKKKTKEGKNKKEMDGKTWLATPGMEASNVKRFSTLT